MAKSASQRLLAVCYILAWGHAETPEPVLVGEDAEFGEKRTLRDTVYGLN